MVRGNPTLDQPEEIFRDDLVSLGMGRDRSMIVIDHIALASARSEETKRLYRKKLQAPAWRVQT
jgi:hypothetical protein